MDVVKSMSELFPKAPFIPAAWQRTVPACEWVMPASTIRRGDYFSVYKALPPGMPDCLHVSIDYFDGGIGRCIAAIYSRHAYVIHYGFKPSIIRMV
jgi:hypothetical protein